MAPYETLRLRHLSEYGQDVPVHMQHIRWPAERVQEEQVRLLRIMLASAKSASAWHRERLRDVDCERFGLSNLTALPTMSKEDLVANFDGILTDPRLSRELVESHLESLGDDAYLLDEFHAVASGGSSGVRGLFVFGWDAWKTATLAMLRFRMAHASSFGIPRDALRCVVAGGKASHMSYAMTRTFGSSTNSVAVPASLPVNEIVKRLNGFQPVILSGFPSMIATLAHEQVAGRLSISPGVVWTASEPLLPEMRELVGETWRVPVINSYATSEGAFASDCGTGQGLHLAEDLCIFEPVDSEGKPVPAGERSAGLLVTPLYNPTQPLIRYEITDEVTLLDGTCPCGSGMRRIADVGGRNDDLFQYGNTVIHPIAFRSVLGRNRNIVEYQVVQTKHGAEVAVRTVAPVRSDELVGALTSELQGLGLARPEVTVRFVDHFERQSSGKLKRFVPLRRSGADS